MNCVMEEDGYAEVKRARPQRTPITLAEFIPQPIEVKNTFIALVSDEDYEDGARDFQGTPATIPSTNPAARSAGPFK